MIHKPCDFNPDDTMQNFFIYMKLSFTRMSFPFHVKSIFLVLFYSWEDSGSASYPPKVP